ncbi:MAG: AAA family ATPase [archaeon]|nr:AAA family ATPase [archaeon]
MSIHGSKPMIGEQDFKRLRENDGLYIDKTLLVKDLVDRCLCGSYMFDRPHGFGKTLALSMLDAFFNIEYKGNTWFEGLEITEHPECLQHMNRYPVVSVSFDTLSCSSYDEFIRSFRELAKSFLSKYRFLEESERLDRFFKEKYRGLAYGEMSEHDPFYVFEFIVNGLCEHYGSKVIVMFDGYDGVFDTACNKEFFERVRDRFVYMFLCLLKGNEDVEMGVVMGLMKVSKGDDFGGLNNLIESNVYWPDDEERFGFTADEAKGICSHYGRPEKFDEMTGWYGGHLYKGRDVYSPDSVLRYVSNGFVPAVYSDETVDGYIFTGYLDSLGPRSISDLHDMVDGKDMAMCPDDCCSYRDLVKHGHYDGSAMGLAGYFRVSDHSYMGCYASVPNKEVSLLFYRKIMRYLDLDVSEVSGLVVSLVSGDDGEAVRFLEELFSKPVYRKVLDDERLYLLFLLGMAFYLRGECRVTGDFGSDDEGCTLCIGHSKEGAPCRMAVRRDPDGGCTVISGEEVLSDRS